MSKFVTLLRSQQIPSAVYYSPFSTQWSDDEILKQLKEVDCSHLELETLPSLPRCVKLNCSHNQLTSLPSLPECIKLNCSHNQLNVLPLYPNLGFLNCQHNQLTGITFFPRLQIIWSEGNCQSSTRPFWVPSTIPWNDQLWRSVQIESNIDITQEYRNFRKSMDLLNGNESKEPRTVEVMKLALIRKHTRCVPLIEVSYLLGNSSNLAKVAPDLVSKLETELLGGRPIWVLDDLKWREDLARKIQISSLIDDQKKISLITEKCKDLLAEVDRTTGSTKRLGVIVVLFKMLMDQKWYCDVHPEFLAIFRKKLKEFADTEREWTPMFQYLFDELSGV